MKLELKALKKPNSFRSQFMNVVTVYEELLSVHEPKESCKSKCPTKCWACK